MPDVRTINGTPLIDEPTSLHWHVVYQSWVLTARVLWH